MSFRGDYKHNEFAKRLNDALDEIGVPPKGSNRQKIVGDLFGVTQKGARKWLEGESIPRMGTLRRICEKVDRNVNYLLTGEGPAKISSTTVSPHYVNTALPDNSIIIKQYDDVAGSMGSGIMLRDQPGQITEWMVTREWISKNIPTNSGKQNLRIVTGFGDSMRGMFNSGDPLIVDTGVKLVEYDAVYFFRVGNEGFIKRLQRVPGKGLLAISENKAYESWYITDDMDFECFGRILKAWQSGEF